MLVVFPLFTLTRSKQFAMIRILSSFNRGRQPRGLGNLQRVSANTPTKVTSEKPPSRATDEHVMCLRPPPPLLSLSSSLLNVQYFHCLVFLQRSCLFAGIYFNVHWWRGLSAGCCQSEACRVLFCFFLYLQGSSVVVLMALDCIMWP